MIDLSVSWNTSDPVFKKLEGGPRAMGNPCATTNDELFTLVEGTGYIYNMRSGTWRAIHNSYFELETRKGSRTSIAAADPETGIVYLPETYFTTMLSVNLRTDAFNRSDVKIYADEGIDIVVWNAYLKGMWVQNARFSPNLFMPSKVSKSSTGWSELGVGRPPGIPMKWTCSAPAHGGSTMVFLEYKIVYILDVVKKTWKKAPPGPDVVGNTCAVTGDQLIVWGGLIKGSSISNNTFVLNIKTMKWASRYIAPPSQSTTTTAVTTAMNSHTSQPSPQATTTANPTDMKFVAIIVVSIGILLAINLWIIVRHRRRRRKSNSGGQRTGPNGSPTDTLDIMDDNIDTSVKGHAIRSSHRREPFETGPNFQRLSSDHSTGSRWHISSLLGRLHQGSFGARELSEHPHAIVEESTSKRDPQDAFEVQSCSQHPYNTVGDKYTPKHGNKAIQQSTRHYGGKEEFLDH
jgi:hypothetical protein